MDSDKPGQQPMPDEANLTDDEIKTAIYNACPTTIGLSNVDWYTARPMTRAAAEKAWHARGAEVAELQEYKDNNDYTEGIQIRYLEQTLARIAKERDAALEQVRALVETGTETLEDGCDMVHDKLLATIAAVMEDTNDN